MIKKPSDVTNTEMESGDEDSDQDAKPQVSKPVA
jgi:hypothetical protein